jgi:cobalamin-dependent methionine synthase I|tara:strand:- start:404 stop:592 length:189 start_codon:yes stop_codon:yes gene_type:complete
MNLNKDKITITITKEKIKQAASMVDMMMSSGSLYKEHPMVELLNEIVDECIKIKKKKNIINS